LLQTGDAAEVVRICEKRRVIWSLVMRILGILMRLGVVGQPLHVGRSGQPFLRDSRR
jgi:hypothetical protein